MKKMYFITILLICHSLTATACPTGSYTNYCSYEGFPSGGNIDVAFSKVEIPNFPGIVRSYQAILSKNLVVTVTKTQGHSAVYEMTAKNEGQEILNDAYVDFAPFRFLNISGAVDGKHLHCVFDPSY